MFTFKFEIVNDYDFLEKEFIEQIKKTKKSAIIITPITILNILQNINEMAYENKDVKFTLVSLIDMKAHGTIIELLLEYGNIDIRFTPFPILYFVILRDAKEIVFASMSNQGSEILGYKTDHPGFIELYTQIIGPVFMANTRPIEADAKEKKSSSTSKLSNQVESVSVKKKIENLKDGSYKITLNIENTSDNPIEKSFSVLDIVPDNAMYGDHSHDPEITDELGPDTLKWNFEFIDSKEKFEISYKITPSKGFSSSEFKDPIIKSS